MLKPSLRLILAASLTLLSTAGQAQTYTHGAITATVNNIANHDSTQCSSTCSINYHIVMTPSAAGDTVRVVDTSTGMLIGMVVNVTGADPWVTNIPVPIMGSPLNDDQLFSGSLAIFSGPITKIVFKTDTIKGIINNNVLSVSNPCHYGSVSGMTYIDNNNDCIYNAGDVPVAALPISSIANLTSPSMATKYVSQQTDGTGHYNLSVLQSWMTNYSVSVPSYYAFIFPHTSCYSGSYTFTTVPQANVDFPLQCTNNVDVMCYAASPGFVRPLHSFVMSPYVSNTGCDSVSGQLTLIKDSRTTYDPSLSFMPATTVSGDTLTWNYANLNDVTASGYWNSFIAGVNLTPISTVSIGDTLCFRVYTGIPVTDINPLNNDYTICLPVVNSYDPNIKEVNPAGTGSQGYISDTTTLLTYTIHFQNTGTSYAQNVSVVDTLGTNIIPASLKILGVSSAMTPEWLAPGVVRFNFNNIFLRDSASDESRSHGSVRFSVNINSALPSGTQIANKGYIYFDYNPAIITNTALNTIAMQDTTTDTTVITTGILTTNTTQIKVYPNPASDHLVIENAQNGQVNVTDVKGSLVLTQTISDNKTSLDINGLTPGIYFVKIATANKTTIKKFIKQ